MGISVSHEKMKILGAMGLFVIFSGLPVAASDCADKSGDVAIADCTRRINSGKFRGAEQVRNYYNRGIEYSNKGDRERAIADYTQAINLDPKYAKAYNNRSNEYFEKGEFDNAIADLNKAISFDPKYAEAYDNRGNAYSGKGDQDRAIVEYNQSISLDPKNAKAYNNRGDSYRLKGDVDRAIADLNQAVTLDPKYIRAYANRGLAYGDKGDYDRAIADFSQLIGMDSKDSISHFNRGRLNLYAGSLDKALADLNQANALDPKNAYGALWLEIASRRSNLPSRLAQASSQIDMTAWPAPIIGLFSGQMTVGALLAAADNPDAAKKKRQVCEANFFTGELSQLKGEKEEATRLFRVAAKDCPHGFVAWSAANSELKALGAAP
jgi:lipoprotein NlpI